MRSMVTTGAPGWSRRAQVPGLNNFDMGIIQEMPSNFREVYLPNGKILTIDFKADASRR
jgi:hypothetical protein